MNKNRHTPATPKLILFVGILMAVLVIEGFYLSSYKSDSNEMLLKKKDFVALVGLGDLAISTEATFIRHRSLSSVFSIYKDDGSLREYFPSTFTYSHSHIINRSKSE